MQEIVPKDKCVGCAVCFNVCPHGAITMVPDSLGFLEPLINNDICTDCGACQRKCPVLQQEICNNGDFPLYYAARHKDIKQVETSRSGGVFPALYKWILSHEGAVYGAILSKGKVIHTRANTIELCEQMKGSKYTQSVLADTFKNVLKDLSTGIWVLFSGTPCQIAALNSFIPSRIKTKLVTCDIICHGVPSPKIFEEYFSVLNSQVGPITNFLFRDKSLHGWHSHVESYVTADGKKEYSSFYKNLFSDHVMIRSACLKCKYTNLNREGDITLGDYWGWERLDKSLNIDDKGLSLILINSEKGRDILFNISKDLNLSLSTFDKASQSHLFKSTNPSRLRAWFIMHYTNSGFAFVVKYEQFIRLKNVIKKKIPLLYWITTKLITVLFIKQKNK